MQVPDKQVVGDHTGAEEHCKGNEYRYDISSRHPLHGKRISKHRGHHKVYDRTCDSYEDRGAVTFQDL